MTTVFKLKASLAMVALLALPLAHAATTSKAEYDAGRDRASTQYKTDKAACDAMSANAKDICIQEAKGKEKVAGAELKYAYTAKAGDQNKVRVAKAEAAYAVAKEKCDDQAGNAKDVCVKEAKAVEAKALADVKMNKEVSEAGKDAKDTKRDADYKVATEKCDSMTGDAKSSCIAAAKASFGKS